MENTDYNVKMCPFRKTTKRTMVTQYQQGSCGVVGIGDPTLLRNLSEPINNETVVEDFMPCLLERCPHYRKGGKDGYCTKA